MAKEIQGSRIDVEERVEKAEEMLCAGVAPGRVERRLATDYGITPRQARRYIARVYKRWQTQTDKDAPHRREKIIRMAERFYAKALAEKQYTAAAGILNLLARMSGAFTMHDPDREKALAALGPPPDDPTLAVVYAQRCMIYALREVINNPSIDPERRLRWIADIGAKIGLTHAKALVESKLDKIAGRVLPQHEADGDGTEPVSTEEWFGSGDARSGHARVDALRRPGADPPTAEDRGEDPQGGGKVGSP